MNDELARREGGQGRPGLIVAQLAGWDVQPDGSVFRPDGTVANSGVVSVLLDGVTMDTLGTPDLLPWNPDYVPASTHFTLRGDLEQAQGVGVDRLLGRWPYLAARFYWKGITYQMAGAITSYEEHASARRAQWRLTFQGLDVVSWGARWDDRTGLAALPGAPLPPSLDRPSTLPRGGRGGAILQPAPVDSGDHNPALPPYLGDADA